MVLNLFEPLKFYCIIYFCGCFEGALIWKAINYMSRESSEKNAGLSLLQYQNSIKIADTSPIPRSRREEIRRHLLM